MTHKMKKCISGAIAAFILVSCYTIIASASTESWSSANGGTVSIFMTPDNRAYWSEYYVYAYDRRFSGSNYKTSGSTVKLMGQTYRSETGWITQDSWELDPGFSTFDLYTWAKTTSQWRVQLRTTSNRYDSYAEASMYPS